MTLNREEVSVCSVQPRSGISEMRRPEFAKKKREGERDEFFSHIREKGNQ